MARWLQIGIKSVAMDVGLNSSNLAHPPRGKAAEDVELTSANISYSFLHRAEVEIERLCDSQQKQPQTTLNVLESLTDFLHVKSMSISLAEVENGGS